MVLDDSGAGRLTHCAEPVSWVGRTRLNGRNGRVLQVWSCEGHKEGLDGLRPIAS
jgi:hypothetical protein